MKKLIFLLTVFAAAMLGACNDPVDTADNHDVKFDVEPLVVGPSAGTHTLDISSNVRWKVTDYNGNITSVTPDNGEGDGQLTITVSENAGFVPIINMVILEMDEEDRINQSFIARVEQRALPAELAISSEGIDAACYNGVVTFNVESNTIWDVTYPEGVKVVPDSGELNGQVTVYYPENLSAAGIEHDIVVSTSVEPKPTHTFKVNQAMFSKNTTITHHGDTYNIVYMDDNRWWFGDNMRYVPEGKTPAASVEELGIWYPVSNANPAVWMTEADAAQWGYMYDMATALGVDAITLENCDTFEGAQGICPDGWHIPTAAELTEFADKNTMELAPLQEAGFLNGFQGSVMKSNSTANRAINRAGGIFSSTNMSKVEQEGTGRLTIMNRGMMFINNTGKINVANVSVFNGYIVRCINDEFPAEEEE